MPPATLIEYYLYQAHYLKARNGGTDYAVVWTNAAAAGIGRDASVGANDYASAIVNALQGLGYVGGQPNICASYVPTEKCLGMTKMRQFRRIYYWAGAAIEYRQLTGDPPWNATPFNPLVGGLAMSRCDRLDGFLLNPNAHLPAASAALALAELPVGVVPLVPPVGPWAPVLPVHGRRMPPPLVAADPPMRAIQPRNDATSDIRNELLITLAFACVDASYGAGGGPLGRRIGCVLVDDHDVLLAAGVNNANQHLTLHGETTLMTAYVSANNQLPNNCRLYTTLEPCHMCAGMLYDTAFGHNIRVYYGQNDPSIVNSILARSRLQLELPIGSDIAETVINVGIDHDINRLTDALDHAESARSFGTAMLKYRNLRNRLRGADERALWLQGWSLLHRLDPNLRLE